MEYVASDMGEFISAVDSIVDDFGRAHAWWRGHQVSDWELCPSLYRLTSDPRVETNLTNRFRLLAPARCQNPPLQDDYASWLFLMQHYGLPTRLLDWTMSSLVALFFALEKGIDEPGDAMLWALDPVAFNAVADLPGILTPDSTGLGGLVREAFVRNAGPHDERILAIHTQQADVRQMIQQSVFTIHGNAVPLEAHERSAEHLRSVRIPEAAKNNLAASLEYLGVSRAWLFPDLDNLALDLGAMDFTLPA